MPLIPEKTALSDLIIDLFTILGNVRYVFL
jgi:hypothetical protein